MTSSSEPLSRGAKYLRLAAIGALIAAAATAFAYVNGTLDPQRITPDRLVDTLERNAAKPYPGYRRNHAKGVCVSGYFEGNGRLSEFSSAALFGAVRTPVVGRFALPGGNPYAADGAVPIRSLALRLTQADGQQWRTGMNSMPLFAVGTPEAFFEQLQAAAPDPKTGKPDPARMAAFNQAHPETAPLREWIKTIKPSSSFSTLDYNALNAFYLVNGQGQRQAVRWGVVAQQHDGQAAGEGADFLAADLAQRLAAGPLRWTLRMTFAQPGDPIDDASKAWPAERRSVDAGTLVLQSTQPQDDSECRDINYDPLILPSGLQASDDPLLVARSAAYASSYQRRAGEVPALGHSRSSLVQSAGEQRP